jgi:tRNA threonylcarbamoyl adenosine modification protein YeaZ
MAAVAGLLAGQNLAAADLCALCAGVGPGSFSGIRSSLAALQGLALPAGTAVFGVSSAAALAYRMLTEPDAPSRVAIVGDARRERLWVGSFRLAAAGGVEAVGGDGRARAVSQTADDFELVRAGDVASAVPAGARVASPDFGRIGATLNAALGGERVIQTAVYSDAESVGRLFLAAPDAARREPLPVYLHPAVAEKTG